jgi:hypothetical protein
MARRAETVISSPCWVAAIASNSPRSAIDEQHPGRRCASLREILSAIRGAKEICRPVIDWGKQGDDGKGPSRTLVDCHLKSPQLLSVLESMAGTTGLEPATSAVTEWQGQRNQWFNGFHKSSFGAGKWVTEHLKVPSFVPSFVSSDRLFQRQMS